MVLGDFLGQQWATTEKYVLGYDGVKDLLASIQRPQWAKDMIAAKKAKEKAEREAERERERIRSEEWEKNHPPTPIEESVRQSSVSTKRKPNQRQNPSRNLSSVRQSDRENGNLIVKRSSKKHSFDTEAGRMAFRVIKRGRCRRDSQVRCPQASIYHGWWYQRSNC